MPSAILPETGEVRQSEFFLTAIELPGGFVYQRDFISVGEEAALVGAIEKLDFAEIKMRGVVAKRRAAHFGRDYEYQTRQISHPLPIPEFLLPLRQRVAGIAGRNPEEFAELLVTEYPPGAGIGWHRDAPGFDIIVGVSLLGECTMRFRPWPAKKNEAGKRTKPVAQVLERRSLYILRGDSRTRWEHQIPPQTTPRYSITFRTLRA